MLLVLIFRQNEPTSDEQNDPILAGQNEPTSHDHNVTITVRQDDTAAVGQDETTSVGQDETTSGNKPETPALMAAVRAYYEQVDEENWSYTYAHLDSQTKGMFEKKEWYFKNQFYADTDPNLKSIRIKINGAPSNPPVEVNIQRRFADNSLRERDTFFVLENGVWKHRFDQEEMSLFMPDASLQEFVEANGVSLPRGEAIEERAVDDVIRDHYDAIGDGDYEEAYNFFSRAFRKQNEKTGWIQKEEAHDIVSITVYAVDVTKISKDGATARVFMGSEDNTGNPLYSLTWRLVKEKGEWKLHYQGPLSQQIDGLDG